MFLVPLFSKYIPLFLICSMLFFHLPMEAQLPSFSWPDGKKAAISLSFDDARTSHPETGKELFRRLQTKVTFYVLPGAVEEHLEDWKEMVEDGHEIGNHTVYHPCTGNFSWSRDNALEDYSISSMRQELLAANQQIQEMLGIVPVSYAYTCGNTFVGRGAHTKSYVPLVHELFGSGRGFMNEALNDPLFVDLGQLQGIDMDGKSFEQDIMPRIEEAVENGQWLVLAGHEIGEGGRQTTRIDMLEQLIEYVGQHSEDIWLAPVGEVAAHIKQQRTQTAADLKPLLSFCATFDKGYDADYAKGDGAIYGASSYSDHKQAIPHMIPEEVQIAEGKGYRGNALEFKRKGAPAIFYLAKDNMNYNTTNWSGTISLWLSLSPEIDLAPGYTDPIQITDSGYDDAALWVDFTKENPRDFRMGVFGDVSVWNPEKKSPDTNEDFLNRVLLAKDLPFSRARWTHVVISFSGLHTEQGTASFYINGELQGSRSIEEPFSWEEEQAKIFLGLNFIGLMDEVAVFDRALTAEEVSMLYGLPEGIKALLENVGTEN